MNSVQIKILEFLKGLGTILLYYVISLGAGLCLQDLNFHENLVIATLSQILYYLILLLILGILYRKRLYKDIKEFKKEYVGIAFKNWLIGVGVMLILNIIISYFTTEVASNEAANRVLLNSYPISSIISMVFLGPLIEEITFRASFKKAFSKWYTFAIVTSLIFGMAHIQNFFTNYQLTELLYLLPYSALGFFFAKAFYETDNIYTSFLAHMFHNGMCVIILLILALLEA